jgi:hypothetical protein
MYDVGGLLDQFCPNCTCYFTQDAVRIGNPFYYKILARNYNCNYLLRRVTFSQLTNAYTSVTKTT